MVALLQKEAGSSRFSSASYLEGLMAELDRAQISQRLQQARISAGLSQEELADLLHVHVNSIQNWESVRKATVPFDRIDEWAASTGTSKVWILHGEEAAMPQREVEERLERLEALVLELREMLRRRDDPQQGSMP